MDLERIKIFKDIAQTHSVSKGAALNGISQSAASQYLQDLEQQLGVTLLDRTSRPLKVTEAGKLYLGMCRDMLRRHSEFLSALERFKTEIEGTVRLVTQRVNSPDRLVDVFVSVPQGTKLLLAAYVHGEIIVASRETLVVPRDAVLPDDGSHTLYVVQDHRALKKTVEIGLQTDSQVEVIDPELRDGDQVVTVGNRELADKMQVKVIR